MNDMGNCKLKDVEAHLNALFGHAAKEKESRMKGKLYKYIIYESELSRRIKEEGRCTIKSVEYRDSQDCDFITFTKWPEGSECTLNQFAVEFIYIEEADTNNGCGFS